MARIFSSPRVACSVMAGAAIVLIASHGGAAAQTLDPGWQLVHAGQPGYRDALLESVFDDGSGPPIVGRAYEPSAPIYSEVDPTAAASGTDEPAPVSAAQPAQVVTQQTHSRGPTAAHSQPKAQQQAGQGAVSARQVDPRYLAPVLSGQLRGSQSVTANRRIAAAPPAQSDPPNTGAVPPQQARAAEPTPANYRMVAAPQPQPQPTPQYAAPVRQGRGLFSPTYQVAQQPQRQQLAFGYQTQPQQGYVYPAPAYAPSTYGDMAQQQQMDPRYERQVVDYGGSEKPGTIIVDTPHFFLYLIMNGGKALRYGIGVGRPGFTWAGVKSVSAKREWPDWRPPDEMLARRPDLPHFMPGGPDNPLGARALYLGSTLYRIHGSNEPWSIGTQVSSGCIRLRNDDIIDLYGRVKVGAKVIVI
jgi:lipoprotein-anchoring transpeptidase ErfK/SrfK